MTDKAKNIVFYREICSNVAQSVGLTEDSVVAILDMYTEEQQKVVLAGGIAYFGELIVVKPTELLDNKRYTTAYLSKKISERMGLAYPITNRVLLEFLKTLRILVEKGYSCGLRRMFRIIVTSSRVGVEISQTLSGLLLENGMQARVSITNFRRGVLANKTVDTTTDNKLVGTETLFA